MSRALRPSAHLLLGARSRAQSAFRLLPVLMLLGGCASPAPAARTPEPAAATNTPAASSAAAPPATSAPAPAVPPGTNPVPAPAPALAGTPPALAALNPEQRQVVAEARQRSLEGNHAAAADAWRRLSAATGLPAEAAAEAHIQLALALARAGRGPEALNILDTPPAAQQADQRETFARGLALAAANRHTEAMSTLQSFAAVSPSVAAAVWLEVAERELAARRPRESAEAALKGLDAAQARQLKQHLLEIRSQALAQLGDNEAAFDAHRQVLALATSNATLGEELFRLAEVSRDLGKRPEAIRALGTALDQFPGASTTPDALRLLDELNAAEELDPYILGRARYFAADFRNAVRAFDQYLREDPDGPDAPSARLFRALASLSPGNEPNALRELDGIADASDIDTDIAAQALLEAGQALEGLADPAEAEARYQKLIDRFPRLDAAATAAFRLGLMRHVRGADTEAVAAWDALLARRDDLATSDTARALFWRARSLTRLGDGDAARASLTQAAALRPASYYTLRSAAQLGALGATPTSAETDEQHLARWMAERRLDLNAATQTIASDAAVARAQELSSLGLFRQGNWEVDELLQRYADRADRLYVLARRFFDLGLVGGATRLGVTAMSAASVESPLDAPAALRAVAYPRPFASLTAGAAERYGVDALVLEATLRDASQFDAWSENAATGARGLAMMRPIHAEESARGLQAQAADPFAPVVAVERQAWLLADRLRRFDGRPEATVAALTTTERLVDGWLLRPGASDPDAFIEQIDYPAIRSAVQSTLLTRYAYGLSPAAVAPNGATSVSAADPLAPRLPGPEPTEPWVKIARLAGDLPPAGPFSPAAVVGSTEQQAAFARGALMQRDGDHATAIDVFTPLAAVPDVTVAAAARLRLGQALLGAGRPVEAIEPLQQQATADAGVPASFLLARAYADANRCDDALTHFERFAAASQPILAGHARAAATDCLFRLGRASDAAASLEQAASTPGLPRLQQLAFREQLARARLRAGDQPGAQQELASLLSIARSDSYKAELNYQLGLLEPDQSAAVERFRTALRLDPRGRAAQAALDELVARQDPFARSSEAGETRFEQDRYREAYVAYAASFEANPGDTRATENLYGMGVSLVRLGRDRDGIAGLERIAAHAPNTLGAADGVFRSGRIRESLADLDGAARAYSSVIGQPNAGTRSTDAQFRLAFVQFRQGSYIDAANGWRALAGRVTAAEDRAQALFWLGKALAAAGDTAGARSAWTSARDTDPRGFYGIRADDLLNGRPEPRAELDRTLPLVERAASSDVSAELRAWAASRGGNVAAAQATLDADAGFARAEQLLAIGLRREAILELGALEERLAGDVAALALLGGWEHNRGLYNRALLLAFNLASTARVSLFTGPVAVRKLAYPVPHPAVLAQAARDDQIDPLLFSALMRQESNMDSDVESAAQARGLTQLIAPTAYEAARALGVYQFRSSDLFLPKTSITLGAFTFAQRLARYDQRIFPSLSAYNASQLAVDGWLLAAGEADVDTFAEAIPFTETYPYVQRIYENYRQYLELYGM